MEIFATGLYIAAPIICLVMCFIKLINKKPMPIIFFILLSMLITKMLYTDVELGIAHIDSNSMKQWFNLIYQAVFLSSLFVMLFSAIFDVCKKL